MTARWKARLGFGMGGFVAGVAAATGFIAVFGHDIATEVLAAALLGPACLGGYWVGDITPVG
jgi:tRNA G46 methylase TrmB